MRVRTRPARHRGSGQLFPFCLLALTAGGFLIFAGCQTLPPKSEPAKPTERAAAPEPPPQAPDPGRTREESMQMALLKSRIGDLEGEIRKLNSRSKAERVARESLTQRLEAAQEAREDAIREVVRVRARIQGMASEAEASAMFAEARVVLDRMQEEAYNAQALEDLGRARSYLARGKSALDTGNPGGAAYLFDLISGLYEGMRKSDPRTVKINVSTAVLRRSPSPSSPKLEVLYWGDDVTGVSRDGDWIQVKTDGGQTGWLMEDQVR